MKRVDQFIRKYGEAAGRIIYRLLQTHARDGRTISDLRAEVARLRRQ